MKKDINYYMSLDYPIECYGGEHEIGDAFLAIYTDFDIKASSEDYDEAKAIAKEYLKLKTTEKCTITPQSQQNQ